VSGDEAGGGEERRSLLGEFSTSITPRHEVEMERNFKLTHQDELAADQAFNHHMNNLDQKWLADRHALSDRQLISMTKRPSKPNMIF